MNRTQKLKMNTAASFMNRIVILMSGLILPRLILLYYGSEINGLVASINQFLSIITFLDLGVGSVVQSALYKPLAKKDSVQTSVILSAAKKYFRKIAYFLIIYVIVLIFVYPLIAANQSLNYVGNALLIIAMSISIFAQYYFGIINELLLNADQRSYIQLSAEIVVVLLNLIASALLITRGVSIHTVKFSTSIIYLLRPIFLTYYVNKHYDLSENSDVEGDPLPQRWSGMGQHIAYTIQNSTDIIALTLFSTLENVSIYSVYNMVANAIRVIIQSFTTGITSFFGDLLANEELELLNRYFSKIEWGIHTVVVFLYGMTAILINPFVMLYTSGVNDVKYYAPVFSILLVLSKAAYSLRTPYQTMVFAAGHYRQTQLSSIIEASLNIIISLIMVNAFGLVGITFGTLVSMLYRTIYLVAYLSRNIIHRSLKYFIKQFSVDILTIGIMIFVGLSMLNTFSITSIIDWVHFAVVIGIISLILISLINFIFYKEMLIFILRKFSERIRN